MDLPVFDELNLAITRKLLLFLQGCGKRKRGEGKEFPDGVYWSRLTFAKLQRACDERQLSTMDRSRVPNDDDILRRLVAETPSSS